MSVLPKIVQVEEHLKERYEFRLNTVSNDIEIKYKGIDTYQMMNENTIIIDMLRAGHKGIDKDFKWLMRSDFINQYDPFLEYFKNLEDWDGTTDYIKLLCNHIAVKDAVWFYEMLKKHLVRTIACALGAIPFNKHCLVLHGKQNDGKSSFVRYIAKPFEQYFTEQIDFESKDGLIALCQNIIINIDELSVLTKQDINRVKAFMTTDKVKVRRPYESKPVPAQRRASFFATTNDDEFLTDSTGNVRWLVMKIGGIKHDNGGSGGYCSVDINKVWAQAYNLFTTGFKYQLTREEIERSEKQNKEHVKGFPELDLVREYFEQAPKGSEGAIFLNSTDILRQLQRIVGSEVKINAINVGKALKQLEYPKDQEYNGKKFASYGYWVKDLHSALNSFAKI